MDLRERVVQAYDARQGTQAEIASLFSISVSWLQKLLRFRRATGSLAPKPHAGGRAPKFSGASLEALQKDVKAHPDASLEELLIRSRIDGSIMAVHRALKRLDCRLKKSRCTPPNKIAQT